MRKNTVRLLSLNFIELGAIPRPFDLRITIKVHFFSCVFFFSTSVSS